MKPDAPVAPVLSIVGDSHAIALREGAAQLGIPALGINFSGNFWHAGRFRYGRNGFFVMRLPEIQRKLDTERARAGGACLFGAGVPVLTTAGFHLGRLVPPFGWNGHVTAAEYGRWPGQDEAASSDFVADYIDHFRERHFRLLRQVGRRGKVIVVAPPPIVRRPNYDTFRAVLVQRIRALGVEVYDPREDFAPGYAPMDAALIAEDGVHGNADYGAAVIRNLMQKGLLALPGKNG